VHVDCGDVAEWQICKACVRIRRRSQATPSQEAGGKKAATEQQKNLTGRKAAVSVMEARLAPYLAEQAKRDAK